jgi:enoyl-CoA hydratase/carnithine racemase
MESDRIVTSIEGDVLRVTVNRPEVRNAQTPEMWEEFAHIADRVPESVRFVLLSGVGKDFSSGLDRAALGEGMLEKLQSDPETLITAAQEGFARWTQIPQVVVALVQGNAIGAGFQLALASDVIIANTDARFAMREVSIGLVPDLGGTGALVDALGYRRAFALCATGTFLTATQAHEYGLVHTVADDLAAASAELLDIFRQLDARAVGDVKSLLREVARDRDSWAAERAAQIQRVATLFGARQ